MIFVLCGLDGIYWFICGVVFVGVFMIDDGVSVGFLWGKMFEFGVVDVGNIFVWVVYDCVFLKIVFFLCFYEICGVIV